MGKILRPQIFLSVFAIFLTACESEDAPGNVLSVPVDGYTITATFPGYCDASRTSLNSAGNVLWSSGDEIALMTPATKDRFTLVKGERTTSAEFAGTKSGKAPYFLLYPYSDGCSVQDGKLRFTLPQEQSVSSVSTFGQGASPAVAVLEEGSSTAQFRNLCGVLEIGLSGSGVKISKLEITDLGGAPLWGDCEVDLDGKQGTDEQTMAVTGGSSKLVLNLLKPATLKGTSVISLDVVVPAGSFSRGLSVMAYDMDGYPTCTVRTSNPAARISRSAINVMNGVYLEPSDADSLAVINAPWNWTTSSAGVTTGYATFKLFNKQASISIAHYPESGLSLSIAYHTGSKCITTSTAGIEAGAAVAINGSYFDTGALTANTFYASNGIVICNKALDTRSNGIVGISNNGHSVDIKAASTESFETYASTYTDVIASGPVLIQSGGICSNPSNDFNDTSHPRSIIGKDRNGEIWMIVIDGRFKGLGEGASIKECSRICSFLGLEDAINLDGGGSSSLWTPGTGVLNYPCDNSTWDHNGERKDPTVFVAK